MALSPAEAKRQKEAAARTTKNKKDTEARAARLKAQTQARIRAEADAKAKKEKERLQREAEIKRIWGGGNAVDSKLKNDLRYVESQRIKKQDAVTAAQQNKPATTPAPKPAAKPAAKQTPPPAPQLPPPQPQVQRSPAIGAPVHAQPQAFGSGSQVRDGVLSGTPAPSAFAPQVGQAPKQNAPTPDGGSYGPDGKGLYNAHKKDNPLMQRTFGYQTGGHPGAQQAVTQPAATAPAVQAQPTAPVAAPATNPQYDGNDEPGKLGQAENPLAALNALLQRKKLTISASN